MTTQKFRKMKEVVFIWLIVLFLFGNRIVAQKGNEGIYLNVNDFSKGKVSYINIKEDKRYKMYMHEVFNTSTIKILKGDTAIKLKKDSIFGYRDKENRSYRFYKREAYKILNPFEKILLYCVYISGDRNINSHIVAKYYFSIGANSDIYSLTKSNLEMVFNKDTVFNGLLDEYFRTDNQLTSYDSTNKIYSLNNIYEQYLKSKNGKKN